MKIFFLIIIKKIFSYYMYKFEKYKNKYLELKYGGSIESIDQK